MFDFDPKLINTYSVDDLIGFLKSKKASFGDFQNAGLRYDKQDELKGIIQTDESDWLGACSVNTIDGYNYYLNSHGNRALHDFEARMKVKELEDQKRQLFQDLFDDMRSNVKQYKAPEMRLLYGLTTPTEAMLNEDSPKGRFLKARLRLSDKQLIDNGILPDGNKVLQESILKEDFMLPQLEFKELGDFPTDRTDIYFMGCPSSGKTCALAGFLNYLREIGQLEYVPQFNAQGQDRCKPYYDQLIEGLSLFKAPQSTSKETVSFLKINTGPNRDRRITTVELSGEAFEEMAVSNMNGREVWEKMGAAQCLQNDSKKTMFFLLDYSAIIGQNDSYSEVKQALLLDNALTVFCNDGPNDDDRTLNCTMSKVKTVAIIVTKSDMMDKKEGRPLAKEERIDIAFDYLNKRFKNFMNNLEIVCNRYGINDYKGGIRYKPFVTTFSLGQFYVGNSVVYDESDSKSLAEFILACADKDSKGLGQYFSTSSKKR